MKVQDEMSSQVISTKHMRKNFYKSFPNSSKRRRGKNTPKIYLWTTITLMSNPKKCTTKTESYRPIIVVQLLSHVRLFVIPWTAAPQVSLSFTISHIFLKLMSNELWCHPTILSSVIPFSSCPLSFPASGSFQMSQLFASGSQSIVIT